MKSKSAILLLIAFLWNCAARDLVAAGFRLPDQDAYATSRGEAFVATADNPSAVYYNPAGITQLEGHNIRLGTYAISFTTTFRAPSGGTFDTEDAIHVLPQFFYTYTPEKFPLAFGFGFYSPYGLSVEWPQDTGFRSVAIEGKLTYLTLNPVVAWRVLPSLSVAAGPTLNYSETDLAQGLSPVPNNDEFRFKGDSTDVGFNAGVRWQPHEIISLGATYRSATKMDFEGHTTTAATLPPPGFSLTQDATANFPFPQSAVVGVSFRPTPKWNIEFNAEWTDWNQLKTVPIHQAMPVPPIALNWESSWYYEFGVTHLFSNGWSVSGGYIFNENCMPDANYNPLIADMDRHFFSLGVGYSGQHFAFNVGYQFGYGPTRTVVGSAPNPLTGQSANGRYEFISNALSLSAGWHF